MKRNKRGMKVGTGHHWNYHTDKWDEQKIAPRTWRFRYEQTKGRRGRSAPYGTGMPIKSNLIWSIRARQYAKKISPNKYKLVMEGIKRQIAFRTPRKRWVVSKRRR